MKKLTYKILTPKRTIIIFLLAIFIPSLIAAYLSKGIKTSARRVWNFTIAMHDIFKRYLLGLDLYFIPLYIILYGIILIGIILYGINI